MAMLGHRKPVHYMDGVPQGRAGLEFDLSMVPDGPPILPGSLSGTGWNHQHQMGSSGMWSHLALRPKCRHFIFPIKGCTDRIDIGRDVKAGWAGW